MLLWTCCPWKRDVTHLRLHRFIPWQTLPGALQSPGCAQALERPLFATLKSHFCTSHTPVLTSETKYQREEEETEEEAVTTAGPKCEVTVRCAGDKQSVSPASKPFVSDVAVAGSIAPAFCCRYCTLQLLSTHYNINCVIRLQCLPRDGDRRPTGPAG